MIRTEYEEPQLEVVKFSIDADVMTASVDTGDFNDLQKKALGIDL